MSARLTDAEREALLCDCVVTDPEFSGEEAEEHGNTCATRGEYDLLLSGGQVVERVEQILAARGVR